MLCIKSNLAYAIFQIFQFLFNFFTNHKIVIKQIFKYFNKIRNFEIIYKENYDLILKDYNNID